MPAKRLTDAVVRRARSRAGRRVELWDAQEEGLVLRVSPDGSKVWTVRYRLPDGRRRRYTIGSFPVLGVRAARLGAKQVKVRVQKEKADPQAERVAARQAGEAAKLLRDVSREFLAEVRRRRKAKTADGYAWLLERAILPRLGRRRLADLTRQDVKGLHAALADRPYLANRAIATLSALCSYAERAGIIPLNPCLRAVEKYKEKPRQRFLAPADLARLGTVLAEVEAESPVVVGAIRFLLLSGCRVGEALGARWEDVDLQSGRWQLEDAKGGPRTVCLSAPALALLAGLPRLEGNPFIFPSDRREGRPLTTIKGPWESIRGRAGWPDLRLHDLRRSHGALAVAGGESLLITSRLLGHKSQSVTERVYAPLAPAPEAAAAERVGRAMAAALAGGEGAEVLRFPGGEAAK